MKGTVTKHGANLVRAENWGRKKLAYEIKRERKGTYVYFYFQGPGSTIAELERAYRLEDSIIKFLTVKLEQEPAPPRGTPVRSSTTRSHRWRGSIKSSWSEI